MLDDMKDRDAFVTLLGAAIFVMNKGEVNPDYALERAAAFVNEVEKQFGPVDGG